MDHYRINLSNVRTVRTNTLVTVTMFANRPKKLIYKALKLKLKPNLRYFLRPKFFALNLDIQSFHRLSWQIPIRIPYPLNMSLTHSVTLCQYDRFIIKTLCLKTMGAFAFCIFDAISA